ncbi:MAG: CDP-alcohol phosphatidyltransferase family protein [Elusimicrobia bacterium]|nr:CDP-alcohol phosphatidyltransferase family protein [Elusimicrobiota bacterium]MDE2237899.1 CDP-alcohol phosphatidyltransferase family protein [Elusimicrobiota bacterium]MDE2425568.1 CDP-alcohol phosphatidyltransferase family protein [Elusimicrobiota bacterium]
MNRPPGPASSGSMTIANRLTLLRFLLALAMVAALLRAEPSAHVAALALFVAAMITDGIDGYVARRTHSVSPFGKVADPIADKILVIGAFVGLLRAHVNVPSWGVFLIIARELMMGGVRLLTMSQEGIILAAERWGKISMAVQSGCVIAMLLVLIVSEQARLPSWLLALPYPLTLLCVAVAWLSAYLYIRQARKVLEGSWR